jgi:biopolymer transport protein ExbD/biopolymer transport protein TolR
MARRHRDRVPINAEINVVSLIDVMMLLLVIFMITAPMMQGGVDLNLPKAQVRPLESNSGMVVSIDRNGAIFVDATRMTYREFRSAFKALAEQRAKQGVYLQADGRVSYEQVLRVIAVMNNAGVARIGFSAEPESAK